MTLSTTYLFFSSNSPHRMEIFKVWFLINSPLFLSHCDLNTSWQVQLGYICLGIQHSVSTSKINTWPTLKWYIFSVALVLYQFMTNVKDLICCSKQIISSMYKFYCLQFSFPFIPKLLNPIFFFLRKLIQSKLIDNKR